MLNGKMKTDQEEPEKAKWTDETAPISRKVPDSPRVCAQAREAGAEGGQPTTRRCSKCREVKDLATGFHCDRLRATGYRSQCKDCANAKARARAGAYSEVRVPSPSKQCSKCGQKAQEGAQFGRDRYRPDGLNNQCKACRRATDRERYWADPEVARARDRRSYYRDVEHSRERRRIAARLRYPTTGRIYRRKCYWSNPEVARAKNRESYWKDVERTRQRDRIRSRRWREQNRERYNNRRREYIRSNAAQINRRCRENYHLNREMRLKRAKEYRLRNPEKWLQLARESYRRNAERNRTRNRERSRTYYYRDLERSRERNRQYYHRNIRRERHQRQAYYWRHRDEILARRRRQPYKPKLRHERSPLSLDEQRIGSSGNPGPRLIDMVQNKVSVSPEMQTLAREERSAALRWVSEALSEDDRRIVEAYADSGFDIDQAADIAEMSAEAFREALRGIQGRATQEIGQAELTGENE